MAFNATTLPWDMAKQESPSHSSCAHSFQGHGPTCQICGKQGHTVLICYHQENPNYQAPPKSFNILTPSLSLFNLHGYHPSTTTSLQNSPATWYMDSGATRHFTPNIGILESITPYFDTDQVTIGNGKKLSISHIGHTKLTTTSTPLFLKNVLNSPSISHNLISVTKLCTDNKAFIEFYPTYFPVKDQVTKKTLLQG